MSLTKEDIFNRISSIMTELFELESTTITPDSNLIEDLDIDSIDAVDLLIELKTLTGKKISPEDIKDVKTVQDVVDAIYNHLQNSEKEKPEG